MTRFEGFGPEVRDWFVGLEADNTREYFSAHRAFFEDSVRGQMAALLTELGATFGGEVKMFRPNRDIRFSADKSPYKTNTYGLLLGAEIAPSGLYASISADGIGRADGLRFVTTTWRAAAPVTGWLDEHVGASALSAARRAR